MAKLINLDIEQGIPFSQVFIVQNPDLSLKDLTGYTAKCHFRSLHSQESYAIEASTSNSKIQIDLPTSSITLNLSEEDTTSLGLESYVYDIEIRNSSLVPIRLCQGKVLVDPEVTR